MVTARLRSIHWLRLKNSKDWLGLGSGEDSADDEGRGQGSVSCWLDALSLLDELGGRTVWIRR